jgi:putative DNA primase/helicase
VTIDVDGLLARTPLPEIIGSYTPIKKKGAEWVARCCFHTPDNNPSLGVYFKSNKWNYKCFSCGAAGDALDFLREMEGLDFRASCERLGANVQWQPVVHAPTVKPLPDRVTSKPPVGTQAPSFNLRSLGEPVLTFPIKDIDGSIIAYECRYETIEEDGAPKKVPLIWSWGTRGDQPHSWGIGALTAPRALYGLHRIGERGGAPICLTEGPKKADSASRLLPQYNCLSLTGGAEAWSKHDYSHLSGLSVLLVPDADEPGWRNFCKLAAHLTQSERPPSKVRIVDTLKQPNRPPKGWDVADAEAEEWTGEDFQKWCRARADDYNLAYHDPQKYSERAVETAAPPPPKPALEPVVPPKPYANGHDLLGEVKYKAMSQVTPRSINWLWPGRIARGKLSIVVGNPGLGKSQVCASLSSVVSNGGLWPVDRTRADRGSIVILSAEDDPEDTIRPRLEAAGADLDKVYILEAIRYQTEKGEPAHRGFNLSQDIGRLGSLLHELGDAALVIIDPITAYLGDADSHKNAEVRALLAPLQEMAAHQGAAVIAVSHLTKSAGMDALLRVQGSIGFAAAARAVWGVAKDKDNAQRRLFMPLKNNLGTDNSGFAYMVEGVKLAESDIETSQVMWESQLVTASADEVFGQGDMNHEEVGALSDAKAFLRDILRDGGMETKHLEIEARGAGHSMTTLRRAAKDMKLRIAKDGFGRGSPWKWSLS